jgi:hypothetical protein
MELSHSLGHRIDRLHPDRHAEVGEGEFDLA